MRTNVNLADDARQFADIYAHANGITLGDAITDLIRKGGKAASLPIETVEFGDPRQAFQPSRRAAASSRRKW